MKLMLNIIDNLDEETNCSTNTNKIVAFIFYIILYPFLIIWNVIGTMWFIKIKEKPGSECVNILLILLEIISRRQIMGHYFMAYYQLFPKHRVLNHFNRYFY
jgi:hypothetical protein